MTGFPAPIWRKSSHSGDQGGECVEVAAFAAATVGIRDSKHPVDAELAIGTRQFRALLNQIKAGTFDR